MSARVHHPVFARLYSRVVSAGDAAGMASHRAELLDAVTGRVVEIGAGTGANFAHYPPTTLEVVAVEPEPYLRRQAIGAAAHSPVRVSVVDAVADALPFPDACFDVAVFSLVLCSVPDQASALTEARRVLRPGGELRWYEHVVADTERLARLQRRLDLVWPRLAGGCHIARHTSAAVVDAGFEVEDARSFRFEPSRLARPVAPHVIGRAHKPTSARSPTGLDR